MQKINVLDSSIFNRISAGEVVERPASVIKELVENCLDANATSITIEIKEGGIKLIRVSDNGDGIDYNDLEKAFMPHATSKISKVGDLDSIATLGFRGEALPSIASVSKIELISKTKDSDIGGKISISGGAINFVTEFGCLEGTSIYVKDLFFNTPARLKFLKSKKQEESSVTNIVNRLILSNPNIAFKYIIDDKIIYNSTQKGLKAKIYDVYGKEYVQNLIEIKGRMEGYTLSGYVSLPSFCKANKTYQTLIVNNRYVTNSLVSVAISNAYENFLMKGKFPVFVLNINLDYADIDVNVHPSKMEIKFKDTKTLYNLVYSSVLNALNENNCPVSFKTDDNKNSPETFFEYNKKESLNKPLNEIGGGGFSFNDLKKFGEEIKNISVALPEYKKKNEYDILKSPSALTVFEYEMNSGGKIQEQSLEEIENVVYKNYQKSDISNNTKFTNNFKINSFEMESDKNSSILKEEDYNKNLIENNFNDFKPKEYKQEKIEDVFDYKLIGTLFDTYILIEYDKAIFLFDQHAGHERVLYDKLMKQFEEKKLISQPLLLPYIFSVNEIEEELIENNFEVFSSFGFEIEQFGHLTFRISSVPSILEGINLQEFIFDILKNTTKISTTNEQIKNYFSTCACKSAVKGGQKLSEEEIKILLKKVLSNKTILLCPHGRPICIKLTQYEIEKMFKRIV